MRVERFLCRPYLSVLDNLSPWICANLIPIFGRMSIVHAVMH